MPHHRRLPPSGPPNRPLKARTPARPDGAILKPPAPAAGGFFCRSEETALRDGPLRLGRRRVADRFGGPWRLLHAHRCKRRQRPAPRPIPPRSCRSSAATARERPRTRARSRRRPGSPAASQRQGNPEAAIAVSAARLAVGSLTPRSCDRRRARPRRGRLTSSRRARRWPRSRAAAARERAGLRASRRRRRLTASASSGRAAARRRGRRRASLVRAGPTPPSSRARAVRPPALAASAAVPLVLARPRATRPATGSTEADVARAPDGPAANSLLRQRGRRVRGRRAAGDACSAVHGEGDHGSSPRAARPRHGRLRLHGDGTAAPAVPAATPPRLFRLALEERPAGRPCMPRPRERADPTIAEPIARAARHRATAPRPSTSAGSAALRGRRPRLSARSRELLAGSRKRPGRSRTSTRAGCG